MKHWSILFMVAALTFLIGVSTTLLWFSRRHAIPEPQPMRNVEQPTTSPASPDPCSFNRTEKKKLEASEAIKLAECFIIQNGYTDLAPVEDKAKLTPEAVDPGTDESDMQMRHDSLERQAHGFMQDEKGGGWTIVFRYKRASDEVAHNEGRTYRVARAVVMDAYGNRMSVVHQGFLLDFPGTQRIDRCNRTTPNNSFNRLWRRDFYLPRL
jgi:hypothetical protein